MERAAQMRASCAEQVALDVSSSQRYRSLLRDDVMISDLVSAH